MPPRSASRGRSPAPAAKKSPARAPSKSPARAKSKTPKKESSTVKGVKAASSSSAVSSPVVVSVPSTPLNPVVEGVKLLLGLLILVPFGPFVAWQIFWCTLWEFADKKLIGGIGLVQRFSEKVGPTFSGMMRHPADGFVVLLLLWLGVVMPCAFFYELRRSMTEGFSIVRCLAFNLLRIGPMYANFMWVYVMCHKEAHCLGGSLFKRGVCDKLFSRAFNHWVGIFHGVVPGVFTISHLYNHHRYDNDENDVYSTAFRRRDSFKSWLKYLPEWMAYAVNLSSFISFVKLGEYWKAATTVLSTLYYVAFCLAVAHFSPMFCMWYLLYPLIEGNILLAIVNYTWHAFIEPSDPGNDYVNSLTVIEGLNFCMKEEYHVVHHQYAGVHWTKHKALFEKHLPEYKAGRASIFYKENLFVIFGAIVAGDYAKLADLYYDPENAIPREEKIDMMRRRTQCCGPEIAKLVGRHARAKSQSESFMKKEI